MFIENKLYKKIIEKTIIQTIDIVFLNKKKQMLLGLRNNEPLKGIYYLPGGRRNKNEKIIDSAKRKSLEELGLKIDVKKLCFLGVYDDIFDNSIYQGIGTHCSPITYVYKLDNSEENSLSIDSQHSEFKFFDVNEIDLHNMIKLRVSDMKIKNFI